MRYTRRLCLPHVQNIVASIALGLFLFLAGKMLFSATHALDMALTVMVLFYAYTAQQIYRRDLHGVRAKRDALLPGKKTVRRGLSLLLSWAGFLTIRLIFLWISAVILWRFFGHPITLSAWSRAAYDLEQNPILWVLQREIAYFSLWMLAFLVHARLAARVQRYGEQSVRAIGLFLVVCLLLGLLIWLAAQLLPYWYVDGKWMLFDVSVEKIPRKLLSGELWGLPAAILLLSGILFLVRGVILWDHKEFE